jgi:calmodulin
MKSHLEMSCNYVLYSIIIMLYNTGTIELTELKQVMLQLGQNPAEEDLLDMMRLVDVNGDNEIDFEEFLVMMTMRSGERDTEAELREAFKLFDLDGSGNISRDELKTLMKNLGQALTDEEIDAMIDEVDINQDGEISFHEFQTLMVRSNYRAVDSHGYLCFWLNVSIYSMGDLGDK